MANALTLDIQQLSELKLEKYKQLTVLISFLISLFIFIIIYVVYKIVDNSLEVDVITDPMSRLYNRSYFSNIRQRQIQSKQRYQNTFSLVIYDIDYFKQVNDKHGHHMGDQVLKSFSDMLKKLPGMSIMFSGSAGKNLPL